jgi:hypothetical protein
MKYMLNGDYRGPLLMRLTLSCTLFFVALLWVSNALLYFDRMSLDPASVVRYYRGSEAEFAAPRSYGSMLEVAHAHFAMMAMVLLLLTHLSIFLPWPLRLRVVLVAGTFAAALLQEAGGWLVRFADPAWAWIKIVGFVGLQIGLAVLLVALAWHLGRRARRTADA